MNKQLTLLLLGILLFSIPSYAVESRETSPVEQFGEVFREIVIADSSDDLDDPRDLEFHPGRANELWIANRATDSITMFMIQDLKHNILKTAATLTETISSKK